MDGNNIKLVVFLALLFNFSSAQQNELQCETGAGWFSLGSDRCYKLYYGANERAWQRATELCQSYGSQLVTIRDQYENDQLGQAVMTQTGMNISVWIGLTKKKASIDRYLWSNSMEITENQGMWGDNQPDPSHGDCIYHWKNEEQYVYDRPYVWGLDTCYAKRAFVCEKMAAPAGSFHCFSGGFVRSNDTCNGQSDCMDGSDELDCVSRCHYKVTGSQGSLPRIGFGDGQTCTWAIETPVGTNVYIQFQSFQTESMADFVTVYSGSIIETSATQIARLSGTEGNGMQFRSYNNMMLIKYTSDAIQPSQGFVATYNSVTPTPGQVTTLEALANPQEYTLESFTINNKENFLGMNDYIFVIRAPPSCSQIITLELINITIHDSDRIVFFDGITPRDQVLATVCNSCTYYDVVYSTGSSMSILFQTQKELSEDVKFHIRYRAGCYYETTKQWGYIFTPGYPGGIQYPSNTDCTWKINTQQPITLHFDSDLSLQDDADSWADNMELLKVFDNMTAVHPGDGFTTAALTSTYQVVQTSTGMVEVQFNTSPTRTARGFIATWSIGCQDPMFGDMSNTVTDPSPAVFYYTSSMTLSCPSGYAFQQENIQDTLSSITVECQFMGKWNYLHLPRCRPVYCGDVLTIENGYIEYSTKPVFGGVTSYKCFPGANPQPAFSGGTTNSTCRDDGTWTAAPTCQALSCPFDNARTTVTNGNAAVSNGDGSKIGSIITYSCDMGFQFVGEPISICQENGTWSSNPPTCTRKQCLLGDKIMNGLYSGRNLGDLIDYETTVPVQCNSGFAFADPAVNMVECKADRTLTTLPSCINIVECDQNPNPCQHNCYDTEGSFYCTCNPGYRLVPAAFEAVETLCTDIDECAEDLDHCDQQCFDRDGGYDCACNDPKYTIYSADGTSGLFLPTGETGMLPTDTYFIDHSCVLKNCSEPETVSNGMLLSKQPYYRVGDMIHYQCNLGFLPTFTQMECLQTGQWDRAFPVCVPATCSQENPNGNNVATYVNGPYDYGTKLSLNCARASQTFTWYRYCTFNVQTDQYEMQGSPYECGVIDCGQPDSQPTVPATTFGSQFTYFCNGQITGTSHQGDNIVRCRENGFWDFGNLQCFGSRCTDPGHPAGGDINVDSGLADGSDVSFTCLRSGYTLTSTNTLTCATTNWIGTVPRCVDTEPPTIQNCPQGDAAIISLPRYSPVAGRLPNLNIFDNTGIKSITMSPINANTTMYLDVDTTVTIRVSDYGDLTRTCQLFFRVLDETPPTVTCPSVITIPISKIGGSEPYTFDDTAIGRSDDSNSIQLFSVTPSLPTTFTDADLYKTYSYTATVTDGNNNVATCKSHLFIAPAGCSDLSFPTPLFSTRSCRTSGIQYICDFTCNDGYTFEDSKTKTVTCTSGSWSADLLPACTQDITPPVISCPSSQTIFLTLAMDTNPVNFSNMVVSTQDLNDIQSTVFSPESKEFTASDLYQTQTVQVTVTDKAGNAASCSYEYLTLPTVCSPLSLRKPLFAKDNVCSRINNGYSCQIECSDGYILRNIGKQTTVTCTDLSPWSDASIFPACIIDTVAPTLSCPPSRVVELSEANEQVTIDFTNTNSGYSDHTANDIGELDRVVYSPETILLTSGFVNSPPQTITVTAFDLQQNPSSCDFYISVVAKQCSPLGLPTPVNGLKVCTQINSGWSCDLSCNTNYVFPSSPGTATITSTCSGSSEFNNYVPACTSSFDTRNKLFFGTLRYLYEPTDGTTFSNEDCVDDYIQRQDSSQTSTGQSVYTSMGIMIENTCSLLNDLSLDANFIPDSSTGSISNTNNRQVTLDYRYSMTSTIVNTNEYRTCSETLGVLVNRTSSTFTFQDDIPGNTNCPTLQWLETASLLSTEESCPGPYFDAGQNVGANQCLRCPAGTEYNAGVACTLCPIGSYRQLNSNAGCQTCASGTTRYRGSTSINDCIPACTAGYISATGYIPCYLCPRGSYWTSSTSCTPCTGGKTTNREGASSESFCQDPVGIIESCSLGTQEVTAGNCELCPKGTIRDFVSSNCRNCPISSTSTYTRGGVSDSECYGKCASGLFSASEMSPCSACPKGTYSFNSTYCQPCPSGKTTIGVGSLSDNSCLSDNSLRVRCPPGTFRNADTGNCDLCPIGTYNSLEEQPQCQTCGTSRSTYLTGRTAFAQCFATCEPGFRSVAGLSPCEPCGTGNYWINSTTCQSCVDGTTATTTATSFSECISQCEAGQFSFNGYNQNGGCRSCPLHHYQPNQRQTSCLRCGSTTGYTLNTGQTSAGDCLTSDALCNQNPCLSGGTCTRLNNAFLCTCQTGYYGARCEFAVNYCNSNPCYNGGRCSYTTTGHTCDCEGRATGDNCENIINTCVTTGNDVTCKNGGYCINYGFANLRYKCECPEGYGGDRCDVQTAICTNSTTSGCSVRGTTVCVDDSKDNNLRRLCECRPGFDGSNCENDIDDCASTPCVNGGNCQDRENGYVCTCPTGYSGLQCETRANRCSSKFCGSDVNAMCVDDYTEDQPRCLCSPGYAYGVYTEYSVQVGQAPQTTGTANFVANIDSRDACQNLCTGQTTCIAFTFSQTTQKCYQWTFLTGTNSVTSFNDHDTYTKHTSTPDDDFYTQRVAGSSVWPLNVCHGTTPVSIKCCVPSDASCQNSLSFGTSCNINRCILGQCSNVDVIFKCATSRVFVDNTCTQKTDYCASQPCENGGNCQILFGTYRCSCPLGYAGQRCQTNVNNCDPNPCKDGTSCTDLVNNFECVCQPGWTGKTCNTEVNYCTVGVTCSNQGLCVDGPLSYTCTCFPGFTGDDCENELNECDSNPCLHGGVCTDQLNAFRCACPAGWEGSTCDQITTSCNNALLGGRCLATCLDIFDGYYCQCRTNEYGVNCENSPNACLDYSKCLNGGTCSMDGSDMSCQCTDRNTGEGCQIVRDLCGTYNPCMNGATCSLTTTGYTCSCMPGYTGVNCDEDINECASVTCPGQGTCFDDINGYYCKCPLKKTGSACVRDYDRDYDLFFNNPMGQGYAWIPYPVQYDGGADYLSISLWLRYAMVNGQGTFLSMFTGDKLSESTRFLEFSETGITVYLQSSTETITFDVSGQINNGHWHLFNMVCNMITGEMTLFLDTVIYGTLQHQDLVMPGAVFRFWTVLGCAFDQTHQGCSGSQFYGYLSQVNWYKIELFHRRSEGNENIPSLFDDPKLIFDNPISNMLLVWNEYQLQSGVSRVMPSEANGDLCNIADRNPPCRFYIADTRPTTTNCPNDMMVYSEERLKTIHWNPPTFNNLGAGAVVYPPTYLPGSTFTWGVYDIIYVAQSANGYRGYCSFKIYMTATQCSDPLPQPFSGLQDCDSTDPTGWTGCKVSCTAGNEIIDRSHPNVFTCSASGGWNIDKPFKTFRYPACGVTEVPKSRVDIRLLYDLDSFACIRVKSKLSYELQLVFNSSNILYGGNLCSEVDCTDIQTNITCDTPSTIVDIVIPSADATYLFGSLQTSVEDFLTYHAYGRDIFDFMAIPGELRKCVGVQIASSSTCPEGKPLVGNRCVECGSGNYYRMLEDGHAICDDCPIGTFKSARGHTPCEQCPNGKTTRSTGSYDLADCKDVCAIGQYFDMDTDNCQLCPVGFYQDLTGQFYCKPCGAGFTTEFNGTTTADRCTGTCPNGYELDGSGNCIACAIGTYRNATLHRVCQSCQPGLITPGNASMSSLACTVTACEAGSYLNEALNLCVDCPKGQYQDQKWQKSCRQCSLTNPDQYTTAADGSTSSTECIFFCPSGFEVDSQGNCSPCDVYKYKNNDEDFQSMCRPCRNDYRAPTIASISSSNCTIYLCEVGYKPNAANDGCDPCPLGQYNDVEHATGCKPCQTGRSTVTTNSTSEAQCINFCNSGLYRTSLGACVACPKGTYKNNAAGLFQDCQPCQEFYTTPNIGTTESSFCNIRNCPAGTQRNADDTDCLSCGLGTYQPNENQLSCLDCQGLTSTRNIESTSASQCETYCPSGQVKLSTGCSLCPRGSYKNNADGVFGECQLCPIDKITPTTGAQSIIACTQGNCTAGYKLNALDQCEICPAGTYTDQKWERTCQSCGTDQTTENPGADNRTLCKLECQPGFEDVDDVCRPCRKGYYKPSLEAAACTICLPDTTTETTGAIAQSQCSLPYCYAGQFLYRSDTVTECRDCPYDTYQNQPLMEQCFDCTGGRVTFTTAATAVSACVLDCDSGQEYDPTTQSCKFCPIGYYRNKNIRAQSTCQMCNINVITADIGSEDVTACTVANCTAPGTYRNANNQCVQCPVGTYNNDKWRTSCNDCPLGQSTRTAGSTSITDCRRTCPLGLFVDANNICQLCPIGSYRSDPNQDTCTNCTGGLLTPDAGADSVNECTKSPCTAGQKYTNGICSVCEIGTYQDRSGEFQCVDCPYTPKYTPRPGAVSVEECKSPCTRGQQFNIFTKICSACPVGQYQSNANEFTCTACPLARSFTAQSGATSETQCLSYCDNASANVCSANATCTATSSDPRGYRCQCFSNFDSIGSTTGTICKHKCDNNYCKNGGTCLSEPAPACQCSIWYEGNQCQSRRRADELESDDTKDIIIPVSIGVGGLLLFIILVAVACLCWKARSTPKPSPRYTDYPNERLDKASLYTMDYGTPYNGGGGRMMMQPAPEFVYDNSIIPGGSKPASVIDSAVYRA